MSMGFFDQSQSNVEKIMEGSLNLTLFCQLHLISVTSLVELLLLLLTLMDQTKLHSPRKTSIKYGSSSPKNTSRT